MIPLVRYWIATVPAEYLGPVLIVTWGDEGDGKSWGAFLDMKFWDGPHRRRSGRDKWGYPDSFKFHPLTVKQFEAIRVIHGIPEPPT